MTAESLLRADHNQELEADDRSFLGATERSGRRSGGPTEWRGGLIVEACAGFALADADKMGEYHVDHNP